MRQGRRARTRIAGLLLGIGGGLAGPGGRAADPPPPVTDPSPPHPAVLPGPPSLVDPTALPRPAYAAAEPMAIDLPTVLRLVNANSPAIGIAQARVREALARLDRANVAWLPDLAGGLNYYRMDGQTQNQRGEVFTISRSNLFAGGGFALRMNSANAYYDRLVLRRVTSAEANAARQTTLDAQLGAALAYLDLVEVYGRLAVNADTLDRAETMLRFARNARDAQLSKTAADVNRAETEVQLRRQERIDLQARAAAASAQLARLLLLQPTVDLRPAEPAAVPVALVDGGCTLDDLVGVAARSRPELAAYRELVGAAAERVRKARNGPLLPNVLVDQQIGGFGGGRNEFIGAFGARSVVTVGVGWQVDNLGFGNAAQVRAQRAGYEQAVYRLTAAQAEVAAEVTTAAKVAAAKYESLEVARKAVAEATETYRKLRDTSFNMVGPRAQYDALEPLVAIQQLNQARSQYLAAVVDFNRAQFRLFAALGYPVDQSRPAAASEPRGIATPGGPR